MGNSYVLKHISLFFVCIVRTQKEVFQIVNTPKHTKKKKTNNSTMQQELRVMTN